ncbi:SUF system Fe-S cluster assembly regulator [Chiayiivirga flava]|uniref:FeS assembly SUF system regulator n=1 Tax=Chiayiivirga flava TaxID=659595 RepID=A0A7W8FYM3_9GAMM|nr:SUF system Fe-S cluster assembly regulator [Chiayiivirga flava]MBB5207276.1 FeS assembly SUF system regulator [Chiayiivirga flava]
MLRVTRLTDYATLLLTVLAARPQDVLSASQLAEQTRLELTTVSKVLKPLAQVGLIDGLRGVNGGYRLAREASDIRLIDIVEAMEGPIEMTECSGEHSRCEQQPHCGLTPHWRRVNDVIADALRDVTLAQLLAPASRMTLPPRRIAARLATV